jgi:hypothetical protein
MLSTLLIALGAAVVAAILLAVLERPRKWLVRQARRYWRAVSPRHHEGMVREIEHIAAELNAQASRHEETNLAVERLSAELSVQAGRQQEARLAIERIAATLTERACMEEGNPDDEYRDDHYRWFTGDPDANIDYRRKQQRDLARLYPQRYNEAKDAVERLLKDSDNQG